MSLSVIRATRHIYFSGFAGKLHVGCGEIMAVKILMKLCSAFIVILIL